MTSLMGALSKGFSSKQVIDFLLSKFPEHKEKIQGALSAGFTTDQILQFLDQKRERKQPNRTNEPLTEFSKTRQADIAQSSAINQAALGAGALAVGSLFAPMAAGAIQRALPNSLKEMTPALTAGFQQQAIPAQPLQPPVNQVLPNIPQAAQSIQPQQITANVGQILTKHASKDQVDKLLASGNGPKEVSAFLQKFYPKIKGDIEKEAGQSLEKVVEEYSKSAPKETEIEKPKIEKASIAATPQGVGSVVEMRNGKALVDIDGKKHQVNEDQLEKSPIPEKDLADLHDELIAGIEADTGEDVSRMVQWAGYNPETNTLKFLPHTGDLYTYDDISEEDAKLLRDVLSTRKTSGSNFIGAWKAGSKSPIGAALSKLIKKLQTERGGKGKEYSEKHGTIYSAYEPAIEAKKRKKKTYER
jgi:hypothetical protein